jgi:hypothetical protein
MLMCLVIPAVHAITLNFSRIPSICHYNILMTCDEISTVKYIRYSIDHVHACIFALQD